MASCGSLQKGGDLAGTRIRHGICGREIVGGLKAGRRAVLRSDTVGGSFGASCAVPPFRKPAPRIKLTEVSRKSVNGRVCQNTGSVSGGCGMQSQYGCLLTVGQPSAVEGVARGRSCRAAGPGRDLQGAPRESPNTGARYRKTGSGPAISGIRADLRPRTHAFRLQRGHRKPWLQSRTGAKRITDSPQWVSWSVTAGRNRYPLPTGRRCTAVFPLACFAAPATKP